MFRRFSCKFLLVAVVFFCLLALFVTDTSFAQGKSPGKRVLIGFRQTPGPSEQALVRAHGGVIKYSYHLIPGIAASVPQAAIDGLSRNPNVTMIEDDLTVYAIDAELDYAWGVKRIGAGTVHDSGNKGTGVKVAVIDTGIDYTHPDLNGNYAGGKDFVNNDLDPMDDHYHGTHVAGTIAAEDDGAGVVGVAPEAQLYGLKVLSFSGSGNYSDVIAALEWAVTNGMQVTNNSYGSSGYPGLLVELMFATVEATGIVNVCAAGNSGNLAGTGENMIYPARFASCIAVAATNNSDVRASFSSTGLEMELAAPGSGIPSTFPGGWYVSMSGTSMACPHVSGAAALCIAAGVGDVRGQLIATADDLGDPEWDPWYGHGLVDADEAAGADGSDNPPQVTITNPPDFAIVSGTVSVTASANDDNGVTQVEFFVDAASIGVDTSTPYTVPWDSTTVADGFYTITATVTDTTEQTASDSILVLVSNAVNNPPTTTITSPLDSSEFDDGESITFTGTASDDEDGDLAASLLWISSLDGPIGSGGSFSTSLSVGTHTITVSVTDSGGASASDSISITVNDAADLSVTITRHSVKTRWDKRNGIGKAEAQITFTVNSGSSEQIILEEATDTLGTWILEKPRVEVKINGTRYKWDLSLIGGVATIEFGSHGITLIAGDTVQVKIKLLNNEKTAHSLECNIYADGLLLAGPDIVDWKW